MATSEGAGGGRGKGWGGVYISVGKNQISHSTLVCRGTVIEKHWIMTYMDSRGWEEPNSPPPIYIYLYILLYIYIIIIYIFIIYI